MGLQPSCLLVDALDGEVVGSVIDLSVHIENDRVSTPVKMGVEVGDKGTQFQG